MKWDRTTKRWKHLSQLFISPAAEIEFGAHCDNDNKIPGIFPKIRIGLVKCGSDGLVPILTNILIF